MKRTLLWVTGILLLLWGAAGFGLHYLENGYLTDKIGEAAKASTGSPIEFAQNPDITLFPPAVKFGALSWHGAGPAKKMNISARSAKVELSLAKLFAGQLEIREIVLENPLVEIDAENGPAGLWGNDTKPSRSNSSGEFPFVDMGRLVASGGKVICRLPANTIVADDINFSAENLHKKQEMDVKCDFTLQPDPAGANAGPAILAGNLAFKGKIRYYDPNLTFKRASITYTATDGHKLAALSPFRLAFDGAVNLNDWQYLLHNANLAVPQGIVELEGKGNFADISFEGKSNIEAEIAAIANWFGLEHKPADSNAGKSIIIAGPLSLRKNHLAMENLALKIADASGAGKIMATLPYAGNTLALEGHLNMGKVALGDFSLAPEKPKGPARNTKPAAEPPEYPALNFRVDIAGLDIKKIRITNLGFLAHGENGAYQIDDFTFNIAHGGVLATAQTNFDTNEMALQANGKNVDLGTALSELGIEGLESGKTKFEANLHAKGNDLRSLTHSLSGKGQVESRGLKIGALESLTKILQLFDAKSLDIAESFTIVSAPFSAENGQFRFSPITATSRAISLTGAALVNLQENYLDGSANIKALGMELPVTFSGPFSGIKCGVNPEQILNANKNLPRTILRSFGWDESSVNTHNPKTANK